MTDAALSQWVSLMCYVTSGTKGKGEGRALNI